MINIYLILLDIGVFVVNGILYIFADLNDNNQGNGFPLTNEKQIFTYSTNVEVK